MNYESIEVKVKNDLNGRGIPLMDYTIIKQEKNDFQTSAEKLYQELDEVLGDVSLGFFNKLTLAFTQDKYLRDKIMLKKIIQKNNEYNKECRRLDGRVNTYNNVVDKYLEVKHNLEHDYDNATEKLLILNKSYQLGIEQDSHLKQQIKEAHSIKDFNKIRSIRPKCSENEKGLVWVRNEKSLAAHNQHSLEKSYDMTKLMIGIYSTLSDGYRQLHRENKELLEQSTRMSELLKVTKGLRYLKDDFELFRKKKNQERASLEKAIGMTTETIDASCQNIASTFTEKGPFIGTEQRLYKHSDINLEEMMNLSKQSQERMEKRMNERF